MWGGWLLLRDLWLLQMLLTTSAAVEVAVAEQRQQQQQLQQAVAVALQVAVVAGTAVGPAVDDPERPTTGFDQ